ncbi:PBP1A family penicillin-binding protein [bacterium]|nr:PBP1A family penicillin-binding protein [bacterium]
MSLSRLPDVKSLESWVPTESTRIYDAKGHLLANVHGEENREVVPLGEIPKTLIEAVIAVEDDRFYHHHGINFKGIARAALTDLAEGRKAEGASTITQQLAKNLFLTNNKSWGRKIADAWLAVQIEHRYSKAQILEMYLNQVYWGHNCYGIQAASLNYFGKKTKELTLAESAQLAFLLRGPERYSPYKDPALAKRGQRVALLRMVRAGFITQAQADAASQAPLKHPGTQNFSYKAPYFTSYLLNQLINRYGSDVVMRGGLRIRSTIDWEIQQKAEQLLTQTIATHGKRMNFSQGAIVAIDPRTGYIRAMVGGVSYAKSKFNRVVQAHRQPGSSFKPFVYLTAFERNHAPTSLMNDAKVSYNAGGGKLWTPENYGNSYGGTMTLRQALERSNNIIAVKLLDRVGIDPVIENAHRLGIQSPLGANLSLALGSSEVTPLELASAYSVFAADGMRCEPQAYSIVEDRAGTVVERNDPRPRRVFEADPIRILNDVMTGVVRYGTGAAANIGRPAAGKTGTTSDHRDAWFVGYTPDLVTLVWLGNDDNSKMAGTTGGAVCAPLWKQLMQVALEKTPPTPFPQPEKWTVKATPSVSPAPASASNEFYVPGGEADPTKKPKATPKPTPDPDSLPGDATESLPEESAPSHDSLDL